MSETIVPDQRRTGRSQPNGFDRAARAVLLNLLSRITYGHLTIKEAGRTHVFGPMESEVKATIEVHSPSVWSQILRETSVGVGRSYMDGWWDCDDITSVVRILTRALPTEEGRLRRLGRHLLPIGDRLRSLIPEDKDVDRNNIRAHYDLSNELFALFLDETMAYSCGVFESPEASLSEASVAKFDRLCRKLDLGPGDHLVEIGTGWGGLAVHAARHYGARVTTTTISDRQFEYSKELVAKEGLSAQVRVLNEDYRDLSGTFDKLVSVEMVEAVDWRQYDTFFGTCSALLRPEGLMALQAIVISDQSFERSKTDLDFVKKIIFPGGCVPSVTAISRSLTAASNLRVLDLEDIGRHYAETLARWRSSFRAQAGQVASLGYDATFRRMWEFYLSYCEAGFLERRISTVQMMLAKPDWRSGGLALRSF